MQFWSNHGKQEVLLTSSGVGTVGEKNGVRWIMGAALMEPADSCSRDMSRDSLRLLL